MRRFTLAAVAVVSLAVPAAASAAADIEAVWSFSGGQVAFQSDDGTTYTGTVIRPTTFSSCTHAVGEKMEIEVRLQPDGQWFGLHNWFNTADCTFLATRGRTAYRVLTRPDGSRFLRLCTNDPNGANPQPSIAPDGTTTDAEAGCNDSDFVRDSGGKPTVKQIADLPKSSTKKSCRSRRAFTIHLREPSGDALQSAYVYLNGKRIQARRGDRLTVPIKLTGLPKGRYTVRIVAKTVLGKTIKGTRKYRTCSKRRSGGSHKL